MEPVEQDLRLRRILFHQIGVGRPHVQADDAQRMAASSAQFFGEERSDCLFGPVVSHPQQNPPLQIVDHRQIDLPLPPAHLINANDMHRRARAVFQPVLHRPFHDGGHTLPIQAVLAGRSLPAQFSGESRYRIG